MNDNQVLLEFNLFLILFLKHCQSTYVFLRRKETMFYNHINLGPQFFTRSFIVMMCRALRCLLISRIVCSCLTLLQACGTGAGDWIAFTSLSLQRDQEQAIGQLSNSFQGRLPIFYCEHHLCRSLPTITESGCISTAQGGP
jgi:hypothetical protein